MKRACFATAFLAITFFCCGICLLVLGESVRAVRSDINAAYHAVAAENDILETVEKIESEWQARHAIFRFVLGSDNCFQFESTLARVKARAMENKKSPELFSELSSLDNCIKQNWQTQLLTPENLF